MFIKYEIKLSYYIFLDSNILKCFNLKNFVSGNGFDQKLIDDLLGDFMFGCNIPFIIVKSAYFKKLLFALNPNYKPPSRKTLADTILTRRFNNYKLSIQKMNSRSSVLLIDGWKNKSANTKQVVALLKLDNKKFVFLGTWDFTIKSETGDELSTVVNTSIELAHEHYGVNVYVVVTDNASNMMKMGRTVDIWHLTCSSHSGNLLCQTFVDKDFAKKVQDLITNFKQPRLEQKLVTRKKIKLISIAPTRWCSHRDAFRQVFQALKSLREIAEEDRQFVKDENYRLLTSTDFGDRLNHSILLMDPICEFTNQSQKADCSVAESTEHWLSLNIPVANEVYDDALEKRIDKAINGYGFAANFFHPVYQGRRVVSNPEYNQELNEFFAQNLDQDGKRELEQFKRKEGIFEDLFQQNYKNPVLFWRAARDEFPILSDLAIKLLNIPASTAQLERFFSHWGYVHDSKRNQLLPERSYKLAALYFDMRSEDSVVQKFVNNLENDLI